MVPHSSFGAGVRNSSDIIIGKNGFWPGGHFASGIGEVSAPAVQKRIESQE